MSLPVSLTTIASRLPLLPDIIKSLLTQSLKPESIHIWVSKDPFLIDSGCDTQLPSEFEELLSSDSSIILHWTPNIGPYRKLLPFAHLYPNTPVLVVDDDTVYEKNFVEVAYTFWNQLKCCIAFRSTILDPDMPYSQWLDGAGQEAIGLFHKGNGGVVYHTSWFQDSRIHDSSVFLNMCPTADDIWFNVWRIKQRIVCYCPPSHCIQKSLKTSNCLFQTNESKNDAILKEVLNYIISL